MAFDIFLMCEGEERSFKRELAQKIFGRDAIKPESAMHLVEYPDGSGGCVYCSDDGDLTSMMFNHCGGNTFFDRVWELADVTNSFIIWPDVDCSAAVTRPELVKPLAGIIPDKDYPPHVVRNGQELQQVIFVGDLPGRDNLR